MTRRQFVLALTAAFLGLRELGPRTIAALGASRAPQLAELTVSTGSSPPFAGDGPLFATISPNGDGLRDEAVVSFTLDKPAVVTLDVFRTRKTFEAAVWDERVRLGAGTHELVWRPEPETPPRTYVLSLTVADDSGNRRVYGCGRPGPCHLPPAPVVRVQGVDAAFTRRSYAPGELAELEVSTDARRFAIRLFQSGPEEEPTTRNDELRGVPVGPSRTVRSRRRDGPQRIRVRVGDWPSGLYFAQLTADDGRIGFAPFVVRPETFGQSRVAVVLPTNTWQAYNFQDTDGDGWGDTWYASETITEVDLTRPFLNRGVPPRFRSYDLDFLHWLYRKEKQVDFLSDDDLERFASGDELAGAYDLVVFSGHEEYVTDKMYDIVERYRDLGGNLVFLSANNFFWRVERRGQTIVRDQRWRDIGRPEARLIGIQYLANDDGSFQGSFVVTGTDVAPWLFAGTGLENGSSFGAYGVEIDARTLDSPPGTQVLAVIRDAFGPGRSAEMTYYETEAGAKVFAAGVLNFGGSADIPAVARLLENLWARVSVP